MMRRVGYLFDGGAIEIVEEVDENSLSVQTIWRGEEGWDSAVAEAGPWIGYQPPAPPPVTLQDRRERAWLPIPQFLVACVGAGIMTAEDAVAAQNGEIPPTFEALAGGWTLLQRLEARQWWKDRITANRVGRTDPFLVQVAVDIEVSDQALDALFGIMEE